MKRINLVSCVRAALIEQGISTVKVVDAVNSAIGGLEAIKATDKLGAGSVTKKAYKVTHAVSTQYGGKITMPLLFDAWHSKIEAACKVAVFDTVGIPAVFKDWLAKMAKTEKTEADVEENVET